MKIKKKKINNVGEPTEESKYLSSLPHTRNSIINKIPKHARIHGLLNNICMLKIIQS